MELRCKKCGLDLGNMEKGKIRKGAVLLCDHCWVRAETAVKVAEMAAEGTPDFMKDLFGKFDKKGEY
jgi:hypothetical protein